MSGKSENQKVVIKKYKVEIPKRLPKNTRKFLQDEFRAILGIPTTYLHPYLDPDQHPDKDKSYVYIADQNSGLLTLTWRTKFWEETACEYASVRAFEKIINETLPAWKNDDSMQQIVRDSFRRKVIEDACARLLLGDNRDKELDLERYKTAKVFISELLHTLVRWSTSKNEGQPITKHILVEYPDRNGGKTPKDHRKELIETFDKFTKSKWGPLAAGSPGVALLWNLNTAQTRFITAKHETKPVEIGNNSFDYCPLPAEMAYFFESKEKYSNSVGAKQRLRFSILPSGAVCIGSDVELYFSYRQGEWQAIGTAFANAGWARFAKKYGLEGLRPAILQSLIDASFGSHGACIALVGQTPHEEEISECINEHKTHNKGEQCDANYLPKQFKDDERLSELYKVPEKNVLKEIFKCDYENLKNQASLRKAESTWVDESGKTTQNPIAQACEDEDSQNEDNGNKYDIGLIRFDRLPRSLRHELLCQDGAVIVHRWGAVLGAGVIIKLTDSASGGRKAAAINLAKDGVAFKVSQDGTISIYRRSSKEEGFVHVGDFGGLAS